MAGPICYCVIMCGGCGLVAVVNRKRINSKRRYALLVSVSLVSVCLYRPQNL